ncbi:MAG: class I SAM-dependent methyltransferase [Candidatus Sumerlaeia bacterium]
MSDSKTESPWNESNYRGPEHPVVAAFVRDHLRVFRRMQEEHGAALSRDSKVLELGAGPGVFSDALSGANAFFVATDLHQSMLTRNPAKRKVRCDCTKLPFAHGHFDLVFMGNLLHHLKEPASALKEAARVLKNDGYIWSVEPNALHPLLAIFGLLVRHEWGLLKFTAGYMSRVCREAGLRIHRRVVTGQIFQNTTPEWMLPLVRPLGKGHYFLGGYQLSLIGREQK